MSSYEGRRRALRVLSETGTIAEAARITGNSRNTIAGWKRTGGAVEPLKSAKRPRIHTGPGVSPQHLREKLRITEDECMERAVPCGASRM